MKPCLTLLFATILAVLATGCASQNKAPLSQRGWIGGEYAVSQRASFLTRFDNGPGVAGNLPKPLARTLGAAIRVMSLSTNTPAAMAGLCQGDLITELNHEPVTSLKGFWRTVDRSKPGTALSVKAWRGDKFLECEVPVGLEKYRSGGYVTLVVPTVVHRWDLWPDPGFSLICIGYEPNPGVRHDLVGSKKQPVYDEQWQAYLVFVELSKGERVASQESVAVGRGG